jgi:arylsulfatase A-like enzyme
MGLRQGVKSTKVVGLQDVMPTLLDAAGAAIPDAVDGRSVLNLMRDDINPQWREFLHGEHSGCYGPKDAVEFVTDGKEKYIWYSQTGREQFFVLEDDPTECCDRVNDPAVAGRVAEWRERLIITLQGRPEGFTDGKQLIPGRPHKHLVPCAGV